MNFSKLNDEAYVLLLCDYVLNRHSSRQHRFDFLVGDPGKNGKCVKLPVDAYYEDLKLVIEYNEYQHYQLIEFFDKPHRMTISGVHRGMQRKLYGERRQKVIPENGLQLVDISFRDFQYDGRNRIKRDLWYDVSILRKILIPFVITEHNTTNLQAVFSRNDDIDRMAFMNWRIDPDNGIVNMKNVADGFLQSAIKLAYVCMTDNRRKKADILIFPILHNLNHGIELYLKSIDWTVNLIKGNKQKFEGTHDIRKLYKTLKDKIAGYGGRLSIEDFNEATKGLEAYIDELFEKLKPEGKKDNMDFSRYPFDMSFQDHFYVGAHGTVHIDLENFAERFTVVKTQLKRLFEFLYYHDLQNEELH